MSATFKGGLAPAPAITRDARGRWARVPRSPNPAEPWRWNETIELDDLCASCDGKDHPRPECESCFGTGRLD